MEKTIEKRCRRLHHHVVSVTILDLIACFIIFIIMRWIDNKLEYRSLFRLPAWLLQFLFSYLFEKLFSKYVTLILSYIYISICKSTHLFLILPSLLLQFLFSYFLEKLFPKYITLILYYIYISTCKSIHPTESISKIAFSLVRLVTINRQIVFGILGYLFIFAFQIIAELKSEDLTLNLSDLEMSNRRPSELYFVPLLVTSGIIIPNLYTGRSSSIFVLFISFFLAIVGYYIMVLEIGSPEHRSLLLKIYFKLLHPDFLHNNPLREEKTEKTNLKGATTIKDVRIKRDEAALAIERTCGTTAKEGEQIENSMGYEDFSGLFQESEPSLDEVKEAFSVFDQNRDGLVDAKDLQRVLHNLSVRYGTNLEACERMIEQHDRNKDGNVDLAF